MENIFVEFLPPWVETGLQPAFYDKESGTVLQQTARMYARVNMLIRMFNKLSKNTKTTVEDYINRFNELYTYVHDYFDNLDVQEEINNKLDEMAEDGTLTEIVANFLRIGAIVSFDTLDDMIASEHLIKGAKCQTLGKYSLGDGFGAYYAIDETGEIELDNGLYATLIPNFGGNNYLEDISVTQIKRYDTNCYIITIPLNDSRGNQINPYTSLIKSSPLKHAQEEKTTLTINASLGTHTVISNGEIVQDRDSGNPSLPNAATYLGIKSNRSLVGYQANLTTGQGMINDGVQQAWLAYYPLITNGVISDFDEIDREWASEDANIATRRHPRQCIGQKLDGTIIILTTEGRLVGDWGLTSQQCADILLEYQCINAWNLDGGGSTSTSIKGFKINTNIDSGNTVDRNIDTVLDVKLDTIDEELAKVNSYIGEAMQMNNNRLMTFTKQTIVSDPASKDLNNVKNIESQRINYIVNPINGPVDNAGYFVNIPISLPEQAGKYSKQIWLNRDRNDIYTRSINNLEYTDWKPSTGYKAFLYDRTSPSGFFTLSSDNEEAYEFTAEPAILLSNTQKTNVIEIDPTDRTKLIMNGQYNRAKVTVVYQIITTNTTTKRYFRAYREGVEVGSSVLDFTNDGPTQDVRISHFILSKTNALQLKFQGSAGDLVGRIKVIVESFT